MPTRTREEIEKDIVSTSMDGEYDKLMFHVNEYAQAYEQEIWEKTVVEEGNKLYHKNVYPPQSRWKDGWDDCLSEMIRRHDEAVKE